MEKLDSDLLRTFIAVSDAGSVTDGAKQVLRSQSAVSLQIKRLEDILGHPVFERHGRGVVLTGAGRHLLPIAREVIGRLDNVLHHFAPHGLQGKLRLGIPDDHGQARLTRIVGNFAQTHPQVELEVTCALSTGFPLALSKGQMDLAVYEVETPSPREELLYEDPTCWAASRNRNFSALETLPVALFDQACWWRDAALSSLETGNRPYQIVYSSQSVTGVLAAVRAGVAVGLLGRSSLDDELIVLEQTYGFGPTPTSKLVLGERERSGSDVVAAMKSSIREAFL